MPLVSGRSPAREVALWAFALHALATLWVWARWASGLRGGLLFWMDFPISLLYAGLRGRLFLATSLIAGGLWWSLVAAGFTRLVAVVARRPPSRAR